VSIYANARAADELRRWYPRFLGRIPGPTSDRTVPTRYGETHVLVAGPEGGPPVVVLHGAMATSAHVMVEVGPLLSNYRVYAIDILGHSPMSADARPPLDGYGLWARDVLDGLGLSTPALIGVSYGGFVATRTVAANPDRISRLTLVVPGGLATGSAWRGVTELAIPMALYRWFPSEARLRTFLAPQFTVWDDEWATWLGEAIRGFRLDFRVPPIATAEELRAFRAPVQVFAADDDVHFPGPASIARAREVFPNVVHAELLEGCKHSPPFEDGFRRMLCGKIAAFLED
jgi:2-hydroxy-6-oxonona-2,4-dienedioate hydrolase